MENNTLINSTKLSLNNIAGYEEEKAEASKIINLFKNYDSLMKLGISIPKGLILSGLPGVGKTLMAKVIAAESNVPLFEYEAAEDDTQEKSIINLKALYEKAREQAPAIVFIDELDELVCSYDYMSDFSRTMLKTLLTEIDGIKSSEGILTIATTNYYEKIPFQLLRSGRMDKHIEFELPNLEARQAILELYAKGNELLKHINFKEIAVRTNSLSGADLKNLINETLLQTVACNKNAVTNKDFYDVIPTILFKGIRKKEHGTSVEQVCYHELGHFICEYVLNGNVSEISIERIGSVEGHINPYRTQGYRIMSFSECKNNAIVALAGFASEVIFTGQTYTGNNGDFGKFEGIINEMASSGMLGSKYIFKANNRRRMSIDADLSDGNGSDIRVICFDEYLEIANKIINENKKLIEFLFDKLKTSERLTSEEVKELLEEFKSKN